MGSAELGEMAPAFPKDHDCPGFSRSTTVTLKPSFLSANALDMPMIPEPITVNSGVPDFGLMYDSQQFSRCEH